MENNKINNNNNNKSVVWDLAVGVLCVFVVFVMGVCIFSIVDANIKSPDYSISPKQQAINYYIIEHYDSNKNIKNEYFTHDFSYYKTTIISFDAEPNKQKIYISNNWIVRQITKEQFLWSAPKNL